MLVFGVEMSVDVLLLETSLRGGGDHDFPFSVVFVVTDVGIEEEELFCWRAACCKFSC